MSGTGEATYLLAAEVISPGGRRRDEVEKRHDYAVAGVEHYWIIDPDQPSIRLLKLSRGGRLYHDLALAEGDEVLQVTAPFPVLLVPSALVEDLSAPPSEPPR